jgi:hypothetical protein
MTSGQWRNPVCSRERWKKQLGDGEPGAGADTLVGGCGQKVLGVEHDEALTLVRLLNLIIIVLASM